MMYSSWKFIWTSIVAASGHRMISINSCKSSARIVSTGEGCRVVWCFEWIFQR